MRALARFIMAVGIVALPTIGVGQERASSDRDWVLVVWVAFATGEENTNS